MSSLSSLSPSSSSSLPPPSLVFNKDFLSEIETDYKTPASDAYRKIVLEEFREYLVQHCNELYELSLKNAEEMKWGGSVCLVDCRLIVQTFFISFREAVMDLSPDVGVLFISDDDAFSRFSVSFVTENMESMFVSRDNLVYVYAFEEWIYTTEEFEPLRNVLISCYESKKKKFAKVPNKKCIFCPHCGTNPYNDAIFCHKCGKKL